MSLQYTIVDFYARSQNCEKWLIPSSRLSVRPSIRSPARNSAPTDRIFMNVDIYVFLKNMSRKLKFN